MWSYSAWAFYPLILSQSPIQLYLPLMYLSRINMPFLLCLYPTCLEQIIFIGNSSHSPTHLSFYYEFKQWLYWNLQKPFCEIFLFTLKSQFNWLSQWIGRYIRIRIGGFGLPLKVAYLLSVFFFFFLRRVPWDKKKFST